MDYNGENIQSNMTNTQNISTQDLSKKEKIAIVIFTSRYKILGCVFKDEKHRFSDHLNNISDDFIPITDVKVYSLSENQLLFEDDFIAVNRTDIEMVAEQK